MIDNLIPIVLELTLADIQRDGGKCVERCVETRDGAAYTVRYDYAKYGERWVAILSSVSQGMPPRTPQVSRFDDQCRLGMMEGGCYSPTLEAEQRRREWAEINKGLS